MGAYVNVWDVSMCQCILLLYFSGYTRLQFNDPIQHDDIPYVIRADSFKKKDAFIISPVPQSDNIPNVWKTMNDHGIKAIVLLNKLDGPIRYYWPTKENETFDFGTISVKLLMEAISEHEGITLRIFQLVDNEKSTKIKINQYHLTSWEDDKDIIDDIDIMRSLTKLINRSDETVLIQCLTGTKRSGMFLTFHNALEMLQTAQPVDIICTIKRLKLSNPGIISTYMQYITVYIWFLKVANVLSALEMLD